MKKSDEEIRLNRLKVIEAYIKQNPEFSSTDIWRALNVELKIKSIQTFVSILQHFKRIRMIEAVKVGWKTKYVLCERYRSK